MTSAASCRSLGSGASGSMSCTRRNSRGASPARRIEPMFKQLKYFQSVVRLNSFSEAAEGNYISQSAISQQIQALERELGFKLFERRNRSFTPTPAGEYFYRKSRLRAHVPRCLQDRQRRSAQSAHRLSALLLRQRVSPRTGRIFGQIP